MAWKKTSSADLLFPGRMKPYFSVGMNTMNPCSRSADDNPESPRPSCSRSLSDSLSLKKRRDPVPPGDLGLVGDAGGGLWAPPNRALRRRLSER